MFYGWLLKAAYRNRKIDVMQLSLSLFPNIVPLMRRCGKICSARHVTDVNKIRRMRFACWLPKATNTYSKYVKLVACPLHQWSHESASMLRYNIHTLPELSCLLATLSTNLCTVHRSKISIIVCMLRASNVTTFQLSVRATPVNNNICIYYIANCTIYCTHFTHVLCRMHVI